MSFASVEYTITEDEGSVTLELVRIGDFPVTVRVTTMDGTASGETREVHGKRYFTVGYYTDQALLRLSACKVTTNNWVGFASHHVEF